MDVSELLDVSATKTQTSLVVNISGRLDTTTAPAFDTKIRGHLEDITELVMDCKDLTYISSAGLRVFLTLQKIMTKQGSMKIVHANDSVLEIFEVTGFSEIFNIEK